MNVEIFNRVENKFLLDEKQYQNLMKHLITNMTIDDHLKDRTFYTINNIYYDTDDDYLIKHSLSKPNFKEKLRIRAYGKVTLESMVYIELKKKLNGVVYKRRSAIRLCDAYHFIHTKTMPKHQSYHNTMVLKEIYHFINRYPIKASTFIAYDRIAFKQGSLRLTVDYHIRTRKDQLRLEYGDDGLSLLEPGHFILETKSQLGLPMWLTSVLSKEKIYKTSFSKYGKDYIRRSKEIKEKGVRPCLNLYLAIPQQQPLHY